MTPVGFEVALRFVVVFVVGASLDVALGLSTVMISGNRQPLAVLISE